MSRTRERIGACGLPDTLFTVFRCAVRDVRSAMARTVGMLLMFLLSGVLAGAAKAPDEGHLVPVPSRVELRLTPIRLNPNTGLFETTAIGSNDSGKAVFAPLRLVITKREPGSAQAVNARGLDEKGRPYFDLPLIHGALRPGETTAAVSLQFSLTSASPPKKSPALDFKYQLYASLVPRNNPPVADAGPDQTARVGATVVLDGSGSTDSDGDRLGYRWSLLQRPESSQAVLSGADTLHPAFTVDRCGRYEVALVVSDGTTDSATDTVVISTVNSKPVAQAGSDRTVFVGTRVQLDGSASTDPDGDVLTHGWVLKARPAQSLAELSDAGTAATAFDVDQPGRYEVELIVHDGQVASDPDTVFVDTDNSRPVAAAGPHQTATVGTVVHLDGRASTDADGDQLDFAWSLLAAPPGSQAELADPLRPVSRLTPDVPGSYVAQLIVSDGQLASEPETTEVTVAARPNRAPTITSSPPLQATVDQDYEYAVAADDPDGDALRYALQVSPSGLVIDPWSGVIRWTPLASQIGTAAVAVEADDGRGGTAVQRFELAVQPDDTRTVVPAVTGLLRPMAELAILEAGMRWGGIRFETNPLAEGTVLAQDPPAGGVVLRGTALSLVVSLGPESLLPPDPDTVAPSIDATTPTTTAAAAAFLFSGAHPIQTGVSAGVMQPVRLAVLRGRVLDRNQAPLPGVAVTIKDHAEYGQTLTRADGAFDLAVNGGGVLILNFTKEGYLPAQRPAVPGWQEYPVLEEVRLLPLDARSAVIEAGPGAPPQAAQGSVVTDQDGTRRATALFPAGVQAAMTLPDGTVQPLSTLTVRATEYTVGDQGPHSMPGMLPPSSGYTYAVEWSADEALAAGAETLRFDRPVPVYVDNFLGFPVGMAVPAGYYDRQRAAWIPSDNGRVIKLLSITDQLADIDADGDGAADDASKLNGLGVTDAERQQLAQLFDPGSSWWRVPVTHFTPWDFNWPYGPPADAKAPQQSAPRVAKGLDDPDCQSGSIIECQTQTLGEVLPIVGTGLALHYRSDRTAGRQTAHIIDIPLSGASVPASLKRIELEIQIAGQRHSQTFPAAANQTTRFTWDGLDGYGRRITGVQTATIRIGYTYDAVYQAPAALGNAFGAFSGVPITGSRARNELTLWQTHQTPVGSWSAMPLGLGGWSLNVHHVYDPNGRVLYRGDGGRQSAESLSSSVITTVAGGCSRQPGDIGALTNACMSFPTDVVITPNGGYYIADGRANTIRYVTPEGTIHRAVGGQWGFAGDGGPATEAKVYDPQGISLGPDGSLYFADWGNHRIRRVDPQGIITTVAGNGKPGHSGDGGSALDAQLDSPTDVAAAADGSLYIADTRNSCIRKVSADGIITSVTAHGTNRSFIAGIPAAHAQLDRPGAVAVGPDGVLYISATSNNKVLKVGPDGIIRTVAGYGGIYEIREGVPATETYVHHPFGVTIGPDQSVYVATENRLRRIGPDGIIHSIVGNGKYVDDTLRDGGPPLQAGFRGLVDAAVGVDGSLLVVDADHQRVRKVSPSLPGLQVGETVIPSSDGSEIYLFDGGRHGRTLAALNQTVRYRFTYDAQGLLIAVTDVNGLVTTIERDALGKPTAVVAPFGQRTELETDVQGYLASFTAPGALTHRMTYTADGLLTRFTDPEGHATTFAYDAQGRLVEDRDAIGAAKSLARSEAGNAYTVSLTSATGLTTRYFLEDQANGAQKRRTTLPDGTWTETLHSPAGERKTSLPDGTSMESTVGGDPRFGMQAPIVTSLKLTSGGLTQSATTERTVTLANANDPFSLTKLTDKVTVNGRVSTRVYDAAAKTVTTVSPAGRSGKIVLDSLGRVVRSEWPGLFAAASTYDGQGRLAAVTRGTGLDARAVTFSYTADGNFAAVSDALGRTVEFAYDAAGRLVRQTLADGREIGFSHDRNGNLIELMPPGRPVHRFSYTPVNLTADYQPPTISEGAASTRYDYDPDRRPIRILRPDGQTVDVAYDTAGRLRAITTPDGRSDYAFDAATGQLTAVTTSGGSGVTYTYSGALLTKATWSGAVSGSVGFTYDHDFRVSAVRLNEADPVTYQYDPDSLLVQAGQLSLHRHAQNGLLTGSTLGATADTLQYDGFGEVVDYRVKANGADLLAVQYTYDHGGRIVALTEMMGPERHVYGYVYDAAGQLTQVNKDGVTETFGYDANGNRTHVNGTAVAQSDNQDRLTRFGHAAYRYTANGEFRSKTIGAVMTGYRYDVFGNLKTVELPDGSRIDYLIDGAHRRVGKKVDGTLVKSWLYQDALKPIAEFDGDGHLIARFVYATRVNVPDYLIKGGNTYRIFSDHRGSPRAVVNTADGTVIQRMDYDTWGRVTHDSNPGFQPFGFAGGLYDRDTGLVRFGARDYDPETGRFTAQDPILFAGGSTNLHGYVLNDPVNLIDPDGTNPWLIWQAFRLLLPLTGLGIMSGDDLPGLGGVGGRCVSVVNQVPRRMARVIPAEFVNGSRLAGPNASEAWVTAADDLAGIGTPEELARRLALVDEAGNLILGARAVLTFDTPLSAIASPVFRTNPGFIQGGLTGGGAREFIIPNLRLDQLRNLSITVIK